jgi:hypothetical protein
MDAKPLAEGIPAHFSATSGFRICDANSQSSIAASERGARLNRPSVVHS